MQKTASPSLLRRAVLAVAAGVVAERLVARCADAGEDPHGRIIPVATNVSPELLIVMKGGATAEQTENVVARLSEAGVHARVSRGREATVIGAIGEQELLTSLPLEAYPGVEQVLPILKPYKLVSREISPDPTVIEARGRKIGDGWFGLIAGPCSVETHEQTLEAARAVAAAGATMLRGGAFKPRTSPYSLPGARRRGALHPARGPRGDRLADRHGAAWTRGSVEEVARGRRRHPDRRPQHAELPPARGAGPHRSAGAPQARPVVLGRGAADGGGVRCEGGERADHPLRARHQDVRDARPGSRSTSGPWPC